MCGTVSSVSLGRPAPGRLPPQPLLAALRGLLLGCFDAALLELPAIVEAPRADFVSELFVGRASLSARAAREPRTRADLRVEEALTIVEFRPCYRKDWRV